MADPLNPKDLVAAEMVARGPRTFSFRLMVPENWKVREASDKPLPTNRPEPIAIFEHPANPLVSLQVLGIVLENEISAVNWLHCYIADRGWASDDIAANGPRRARATCRLSIGGTEFTALVTATVNGSTLILLQGVAPRNRLDELGETLSVGVASFNTQQVADPNVIEPWTSVAVTPAIRFGFPASWLRRGPAIGAPDRTAVDLMRLDPQQAPQGIIRIKAIGKTAAQPVDAEILTTLREFGDSGTTFVDPPSPRSVSNIPPFSRVMMLTSGAYTTPSSPLQFQCYGLVHADGVVVASCLGPSADADYYQWAVNRRAFEIAVFSLQV